MSEEQIFRAELRAAVARLSNGYTFADMDPEALDAARDADAKLDAVDPARDLRAALEALRRWERAWAQAGQGGPVPRRGTPPDCTYGPHGPREVDDVQA